mmetsp:Transcript_27898/g.89958  ORF Transcript_27898/g.89958 Transcript_27898/m.89958 type:complete len:236 (+) Transcript_27898:66-773(+)
MSRKQKKEVIDLTLSDSSSSDSPSPPPPAKKAKTGAKLPSWASKTGTQRLMAEFRSLLSEWGDSKPEISDLELVDDQVTLWRLKASNFDEDSSGGRDLNADLKRLKDPWIQLEITFPEDYPRNPFFLRLVRPRMRWYTGHVTAGGSICIEALTNSGTPHSWTSSLCVETILRTVFHNMVHAEEGYVRTANGGGPTGPLRVDHERRYVHDVTLPYSPQEARSAFDRMLHHHRSHGW